MITQAEVYAYLEAETDLPHDIRMDIIEALFEDYTEDKREGYKLTGHREWCKTPICDMLNKPSSIASGFKMLALGGDSDRDNFNKTPDISSLDTEF